jgi:hypothetical protein
MPWRQVNVSKRRPAGSQLHVRSQPCVLGAEGRGGVFGYGAGDDAKESNHRRKRGQCILDGVGSSGMRGCEDDDADRGPEYPDTETCNPRNFVAEADEPPMRPHEQRRGDEGPEKEAWRDLTPVSADAPDEHKGGPQPSTGTEETAMTRCKPWRFFHIEFARACLPGISWNGGGPPAGLRFRCAPDSYNEPVRA